jgi:hypothetical protein
VQTYALFDYNVIIWYDFRAILVMKKLFFLLVLSVSLFSCKDDEETTSQNSTVVFNFKHLYKQQPLEIKNDNQLVYTTSTGNEYNVKSLKYYISKIILEKVDGTMYDVNMYKLINPAENQNYTQYHLNNIPAGVYNKLHFTFGIDSARNVLLGLPNNSETNSMEWPIVLGGGYHFMMLEGVFRKSDSSLSGYAIHLGKTPNQYKASFNVDLDLSAPSTKNIDIIMNLDQWFDGVNKINLNDGYGYIMEDSLKQIQFKQNASSVFSIEQK